MIPTEWLRIEEPLPPTQIVYRGGLSAREKVFQAGSDFYKIHKVWGISITSDGNKTAEELRELPNNRGFAMYSQYRWARVGNLLNVGWNIFPTGKSPHYTLVLPGELDDNLWSIFENMFSKPIKFGGPNEIHS